MPYMESSNDVIIYAEMHLVFDNDFDVNEITRLIKIEPSECKCRWETRISPLTNKQNEGFWTLKSKEKSEWDLKIILEDLLIMFKHKLKEIKDICDEQNGSVIFDIIPSFTPENKPALYFERDFLDIVDYLNATIQIDMYVL